MNRSTGFVAVSAALVKAPALSVVFVSSRFAFWQFVPSLQKLIVPPLIAFIWMVPLYDTSSNTPPAVIVPPGPGGAELPRQEKFRTGGGASMNTFAASAGASGTTCASGVAGLLPQAMRPTRMNGPSFMARRRTPIEFAFQRSSSFRASSHATMGRWVVMGFVAAPSKRRSDAVLAPDSHRRR